MLNPYVRAFEAENLKYDLKSAKEEHRLSRQRVADVFVEDAVLYQVPAKVT